MFVLPVVALVAAEAPAANGAVLVVLVVTCRNLVGFDSVKTHCGDARKASMSWTLSSTGIYAKASCKTCSDAMALPLPLLDEELLFAVAAKANAVLLLLELPA